MKLVGDLIALFSALSWTILAIMYARKLTWWARPEGRLLAVTSFIIALIMAYITLFTFGILKPSLSRDLIRAVIFLPFLVLPIWQIRLIFSAQRRGRREKKANDAETTNGFSGRS